MSYDIAIWEQIRSKVEWKTWPLERDISKEISNDRSLRDFHGVYPVPWQLKEVLKQRADNWIQRLYRPCCDVYRDGGKEISVEFDLAVWAFWIEPFITREVEVLLDGRSPVGFWNPPGVARHSVHLVPINVPWNNHDVILGVLFGIAPEVVVLSGSFQDELSIMRTRHLWPHTVHAVVASALFLPNWRR
jgi:hypothetical protein